MKSEPICKMQIVANEKSSKHFISDSKGNLRYECRNWKEIPPLKIFS